MSGTVSIDNTSIVVNSAGLVGVSPAWVGSYLTTPGNIGLTTPAQGAFTTLSANQINPQFAGGPVSIKGETDGNFPGTGFVGELETNNANPNSSLYPTTGQVISGLSLPLGNGNWDMFGNVTFQPGAGQTLTSISAGLSLVNNSLNSFEFLNARLNCNFTIGQPQTLILPTWAYSSNAAFTLYLSITCAFTGGGTLPWVGQTVARRRS